PWPTLRPGSTVSYTIHFRNTGDTTWNRGSPLRQVNLAVGGDSTALADAGMAVGWLSANRVATTSEISVAPDAIATFTFTLRAPSTPSSGSTVSYTIHFRNTGDTTWNRGSPLRQVNLAVGGDSTALADAGMAVGWLSANRVATTSEISVAPNAIATFTFTLRAPSTPGTYRLPLHPVLEGVQHLEDEGVFVLVVSDPGFHSAWVSQSPYPTLQPGQVSTPLSIAFRNTGTQTWTKGVLGLEARLGINQDDAQWAPLGVNWMSVNRVAAQTEASVASGANATFTFQVRAPQIAGTYSLHLRPVIDGTAWMEDQGVFLTITVPLAAGTVPRL